MIFFLNSSTLSATDFGFSSGLRRPILTGDGSFFTPVLSKRKSKLISCAAILLNLRIGIDVPGACVSQYSGLYLIVYVSGLIVTSNASPTASASLNSLSEYGCIFILSNFASPLVIIVHFFVVMFLKPFLLLPL